MVVYDLVVVLLCVFVFFFFKQKTAYEMRISDWSSDVCSSDLLPFPGRSAIRRRVHALRRLPTAKQDIGGIGAHLTIDQVHLDLSVKHGELDRLAIITLIIDRQTKLILGHALMASY